MYCTYDCLFPCGPERITNKLCMAVIVTGIVIPFESVSNETHRG
jgi:hypothetical protein